YSYQLLGWWPILQKRDRLREAELPTQDHTARRHRLPQTLGIQPPAFPDAHRLRGQECPLPLKAGSRWPPGHAAQLPESQSPSPRGRQLGQLGPGQRLWSRPRPGARAQRLERAAGASAGHPALLLPASPEHSAPSTWTSPPAAGKSRPGALGVCWGSPEPGFCVPCWEQRVAQEASKLRDRNPGWRDDEGTGLPLPPGRRPTSEAVRPWVEPRPSLASRAHLQV
ncbi:hypothetical protein H1C71_007639, partial [Ictidomys tridecemlineatus]